MKATVARFFLPKVPSAAPSFLRRPPAMLETPR